MTETDYSIFNYSVLSRFNKNVFGNLITLNELKSEHEEMFSQNQGINEYYGYYFVVPSEKKMYFFDAVDKTTNTHILDALPVSIVESKKVAYKNKVFYHVDAYNSFKIIPKKVYSYRQIIDKLSDLKHTNKEDMRLWAICATTAYCDKIMLRVSSQAGFGKDSMLRILGSLFNGVVVAKPRTIAKMEYLLRYANAIAFNEVGNLNPEQKRLIEDFILQVGDYSTEYEKGSLATKGIGVNKNDTEKLSLLFLYNDKDHYDDENLFFDNLFNNKAVYDRLLPLRFRGRIDVAQFHNNFDIEQVAKDKQQDFLNILKSMDYYKQFYRMDLKSFKLYKDYQLSERHKKAFMKIIEFINLYADDEKEFNELVESLYNRYLDYCVMIGQVSEQQPKTGLFRYQETCASVCGKCNDVVDATKIEGDWVCPKCQGIAKPI